MQTQQQSVGGVSLDEEMINMIKYQEAYGASSRVVITMNAMLDDLLTDHQMRTPMRVSTSMLYQGSASWIAIGASPDV